MLLLIHKHAEKLVRVLHNGVELKDRGTDICFAFWEVAENYPDEQICWCEESYIKELNSLALKEIFPHDLIMATYTLENSYLPEEIGYIDQHPFINVNPKVRYGTWRMSTDAGGIKGGTLRKFQNKFKKIKDFGFLLNSIAKLGQHNGLLCYSDPRFFKTDLKRKFFSKSVAGIPELLSFVFMHYKTVRVWLLFWCLIKYEHSFPILSLMRSFFRKKIFIQEIDLRDLNKRIEPEDKTSNGLDVIIPTLGRRRYLLQVLEDLANQSLMPKKVIIVEQNPDANSETELPELRSKTWPFQVVHHFIHSTGACNARNMALKEISAEWVFFADDDLRLPTDLIQSSLDELNRMGLDCLNLNAYQTGEKQFFHKIKQWGSFGSGISIVNSNFARKVKFRKVFEYGFGEDQDYGMQLRNIGCDIIYHPEIKVLHLKAPRGGFREVSLPPWGQDNPKPAPTIMLFAKDYYTMQQMKGFKMELFLRNYNLSKNINPIKYWNNMQERWDMSKAWASKLLLR